jgi:hypothetical protein
LQDIKTELNDPNDVLRGWSSFHRDVCPCHWEGVLS